MGVWTPGPGPTTGNDTFTGDNTNEVASGGDGLDTLNGGGGNDTLNGDGGDDTITGGLGFDTLNGGAGNDTFLWVFGDGGDAINGGLDTDTLNISDGASASILNATFNGSSLTVVGGNSLTSVESVNVDMGGGVDWLIYAAGSAAVTVNLGAGTASGFTSVSNIENVIGGNANDSITGSALADRLDGGAGDDTLIGGGGIDTIIGGEGGDTMAGGLGNDSLQGGNGNDTFNWAVGDGRDTITGGNDVDTANFVGTGVAELGNATWNGSAITALLDNGLSGIEAVNLDLGGGIDWLIYNATAAVVVNLSTNSASGFASVTNIEKVIGGSGNDTLTGDAVDNRLDGQGGADTLDGGAGSDSVLGGDGNDVIYASAGNDSLQGQNGNDTFHWTLADGRDTFNGGADFDIVNLTGSATADVADANWNGSAITGLLNNALVDIEAVNLDLGAGGSGGDWLRYNTAFGISVNLATGTGDGFASITGVENLIGGTGNDNLTGDANANKLNGNAGDDVISGGLGADTLTGLSGNDTFNWAWGDGGDVIDGGGDSDTINFTGNASTNFFSAQYNGSVVTSAAGVSFASIEALNVDMGGGEDWLSYATAAAVIANLTNGTASGFASIAGIENIIGGSGNDTLTGDVNANKLQGGAGNDTIDGGAGNDTIDGGADSDTVTYASALAGVTVNLQTVGAQNTIGAGADTISNVENLTGSDFDDTLTGNAAANALAGGAGSDLIDGGAGNDMIDGGADTDTATYANASAGVTVDLQVTTAQNTVGAGTDTITNVENVVGSAFDDTLTGDGSVNTLVGGLGADTLDGGDATDFLTGGAGLDSLHGGAGSDHLYITAPSDMVAGETYDGGGGSDDHVWLQAAGSYDFTSVNVAGLELIVVNAAGVDLTLSAESLGVGFASAMRIDSTGQSPIINVVRSTAGTTNLSSWVFYNPGGTQINLTGSSGDDVLTGSTRGDMIYGGNGADTLSSGGGADAFFGGAGDDTYVFTGVETVTENAGEGTDTLLTSVSVTLGSEIENATATSGAGLTLTGNSSNNVITGGAGVDVLVGAGGADTLNGGGDTDYLTGGAGLDVINAGDASDHIYITAPSDLMVGETYDGGAHNDDHIWLQSTGSYSFVGVNVANMELLVTNAADITVTLDADTLGAGWASALRIDFTNQASTINVVRSSAGTTSLASWVFFNNGGGAQINLIGSTSDDVLTGSSLGDIIVGDYGVDQLYGGNGNDTLRMNDDTALIVGEVYDGGAGYDTLWVNRAINDVRNATVTSIERVLFSVGLSSTEVLYLRTGSIGAGFATNLAIDGGTVAEAVVYVYASSAGTTDVSGWTFNDWSAASYVGFSGSSDADIYIGSSVNDLAVGEGGNDTLSGGLGADQLYGRAGNDTLEGGAGDDLLDGEADTDTASYANAGSGVTVNLSTVGAQNTLGAGTDTLSNIESLTGSAFGDTLTGNASANTLTGGAGNDTIEGGAGDDVLNGGADTDTVTYANAASAVTVSLAVLIAQNTGGAGSDTLSNFESLTGSAFNDALTGDASANTLDGGIGADSMTGGGGNDTYIVDNTSDTVTEGASAGTDLVQSSVTYSIIGIGNVENLTLTGSANIDATGNSLDNIIFGNSGNNQIDGFSGNDTIDGGAGDDRIDSSTGTDTVSYGTALSGVTVSLLLQGSAQNTVGAGSDTIFNTENLTGSSFNDTLTGNGNANTLTGGAGDDTLTGGAGVDTVSGGAGNDTLQIASNGHGQSGESYDGGADTDTLLLGEGNDFRGAGFSSIERMTFGVNNNTSLFDAEDFGGAGFSDSLLVTSLSVTPIIQLYRTTAGTTTLAGWTFNGSAQIVITGSTGNDTLTGSSVGDTIEGGLGNDTLDGGGGTDTLTYVNASAGITISFAAFGSPQNTGGAGTDTINNFENLTGSSFNDTLSGNGNANTIDGGAGIDTISYAGVGNVVNVSLALQGSGQNTAAGGIDTLLNFENLTGSDNSDTLGGDGNNNVIIGNGGNDSITGAAGVDTLTGGLGNDTFVYASGAGSDTITDFDADASGGQDLISLTAFGINSGDFGTRVTITDLGSDTLITIDGSVTITLTGVTGDANNVITQSDFILGP